jgi:hypothetical protein
MQLLMREISNGKSLSDFADMLRELHEDTLVKKQLRFVDCLEQVQKRHPHSAGQRVITDFYATTASSSGTADSVAAAPQPTPWPQHPFKTMPHAAYLSECFQNALTALDRRKAYNSLAASTTSCILKLDLVHGPSKHVRCFQLVVNGMTIITRNES